VKFIADGDELRYVRDTLKDLEAQAKIDEGAIEELKRELKSPVPLPTPEALVGRAQDIEHVLAAEPVMFQVPITSSEIAWFVALPLVVSGDRDVPRARPFTAPGDDQMAPRKQAPVVRAWSGGAPSRASAASAPRRGGAQRGRAAPPRRRAALAARVVVARARNSTFRTHTLPMAKGAGSRSTRRLRSVGNEVHAPEPEQLGCRRPEGVPNVQPLACQRDSERYHGDRSLLFVTLHPQGPPLARRAKRAS
jgi:hypothetical protein